jgi:hypothetical protein
MDGRVIAGPGRGGGVGVAGVVVAAGTAADGQRGDVFAVATTAGTATRDDDVAGCSAFTCWRSARISAAV